MTELRRLFDDLVGLEIAVWDAVDARLRQDCGLTAGQFMPMRVVAATPGCRVLDVAAQLQITVGAASKVVDRVEAAGHCLRRPNPGDRRSSLIELTPAGEVALAGAEVVFEQELQERLGDVLSPTALARFGGDLAKLRAANR
ncbi:MarR family winged helix-turn-helix transcriptional regulator [Actinoplanes friuliensis]|uniref:MarR family transcriptional regulator n=1 Tax=Actinoplanes friuliensis DSM 7358 TaxID=1246995 RepID=U5W034_9ACTN|nr:MarR family transcriptional regulator [Actinoplanes friuliensis]AGZ42558.1 MarR family transcriptional regulator [Actinoplanes friuliensis DSM 7358]